MTFWITASILLFIVVIASTFGPYMGLYGDAKENTEMKNTSSLMMEKGGE